MHEIVEWVVSGLKEAQDVVVCCSAGLGRSGTLAACVLVETNSRYINIYIYTPLSIHLYPSIYLSLYFYSIYTNSFDCFLSIYKLTLPHLLPLVSMSGEEALATVRKVRGTYRAIERKIQEKMVMQFAKRSGSKYLKKKLTLTNHYNNGDQ